MWHNLRTEVIIMKKTPIWQMIADSLRSDIEQGNFSAGDKLPTEAELSTSFKVNRHTVRHAISHLAQAGLVRSRRGAGVFVVPRQAEHHYGRFVQYRENMLTSGSQPIWKILSLATRHIEEDECNTLMQPIGSAVHEWRALASTDNHPVAVLESVFPAERFPDFPELIQETLSVPFVLRQNGVSNYIRARTEITAVAATPDLSDHLQIAEGSPMLRTTLVNTDMRGIPVEAGLAFFVPGRVTLSVTGHLTG